jgi:tetratricopeptide (TPR) repeat protein
VLFEAGRYQEARGELEQGLKASYSDDTNFLQYLAMTEWRLGNRRAARDHQKRAAALIDQLAPKDAGDIQIQKRVDALLGTAG